MNSEMLFNEWKMKAIEDGGDRFRSDSSSALIEELIQSFKHNDVELDDAKRYKKKVIEVLTTEEGRKGKGKYKNWVSSIETRYLGTLSEFYSKANVKSIDLNSCKLIEKWVEYKYPTLDNASLVKEALNPTSYIHRVFLKEVFDSKWFKEQKGFPIWIRELLE